MHPRYPHVFSPIALGPVTIPNRFFFAPHGSALSVGTKPSDDLVAYSAERVRDGGCGLVMVALVAHERGRTRQPSPHLDENVAAFARMADAIHAAGGKIFGQIFYWWGGAGWWQPLSPPAPALGPSSRQFAHGRRASTTRAMTLGEIAGMHEAVRRSAANLRKAGFDGVMLHGSHAGLIEQFLSPYYNAREDDYGGSFANRIRFVAESLEAARAGAGPEMAVGMRFNCDEGVAGGYGIDGARDAVSHLTGRGLLDFLDLDQGMEPQQFAHGMPTGFSEKQLYRPAVAQVREAAGTVPLLSVLGRVTRMAEAEEAIASGVIDMAGCARQLIAEPQFVALAREGREAEGRTCIACNWCTAAGGDGAQGCTINPASYRERLWGVDSFGPAPQPSRVVVIGAGPGGMEAARVAAKRGHRVSLFEARAEPGGALADWARLPGRAHYGDAVRWWWAELERLGVDLRLGIRACAETVLAEAPDAVIVATGARYRSGGQGIASEMPIPGHDRPFVHTPEAVLAGGLDLSGHVLVTDGEGYHAGSGIAEMLAARGAQVTLVSAEMSPVSARLSDAWEERFVLARLKQVGVTLQTGTWVDEIGERRVTLRDVHTGTTRTAPVDAVILATSREPVDDLARALEGRVRQLFTIGDALGPRMFAAASYEGQMFARMIGEPDAPRDFEQAWFAADAACLNPLPADMVRPAG
ncbi:FAD-dependent oxidoreductase [Novosphingobium sp. BL-8H]|uniref:oxidoreductase n=1 Tax=Novosphingobium sp. BL-8H TaxID=3127640 RepID=UPI003756D797